MIHFATNKIIAVYYPLPPAAVIILDVHDVSHCTCNDRPVILQKCIYVTMNVVKNSNYKLPEILANAGYVVEVN
jgi:hypothetical protein